MTEPNLDRQIRELISFAIMDGQNQIHDLKDGTATPEEVNERMFKSLDYFTDKATKLISDQVAKARIDELQDAVIKSGGVNPLLAKYVSDRVAKLESKDE